MGIITPLLDRIINLNQDWFMGTLITLALIILLATIVTRKKNGIKIMALPIAIGITLTGLNVNPIILTITAFLFIIENLDRNKSLSDFVTKTVLRRDK